MLAKPLGQINTAALTQVSVIAETVRDEFGLPEVFATLGARRHRVIEAVPDEQRTLFRAQIAKSLAVGVGETVFAKLNRVFGRDQPETSRALQLGHDCTAFENAATMAHSGRVVNPRSHHNRRRRRVLQAKRLSFATWRRGERAAARSGLERGWRSSGPGRRPRQFSRASSPRHPVTRRRAPCSPRSHHERGAQGGSTHLYRFMNSKITSAATAWPSSLKWKSFAM